jgi:uncharacterized protein
MRSLAIALLLLIDPPPEGHFVADTTNSVSAQTKADVDELAATIHVGGFGELMVLVVDKTNGVPPQKFAVNVFSNWPVGHAENVDGALLLIVVNEKKAALVLGDGYRSITQKQTDALLDQAVLPLLKAGKLNDAVLGGAHAVLELLEKNHHARDGGR